MNAEGPARPSHDGDPSIELVVVAYRSRVQVQQMLGGLPANLPMVVIDNSDGSDGLREVVLARSSARYVEGKGVGFARAANRGARTSTADYLVFLNPDTRPTVDDIATLVRDVATDPTCSQSAGMLVNPDGSAHVGVGGWEPTLLRAVVHAIGLHKIFPEWGVYAKPAVGESIDLDWVNGSCMAVRRETFLDLGCFDEDFYVYLDDIAIGRSARARGLRPRLRTDVIIRGSSGGSGAPALEMMRLRGASMKRYLRKYHSNARATLMTVAFGIGYVIRAGERLIRSDVPSARGYLAYAAGAFTGRATVAGRVVMGS
jgi:GT2 family glycosyltransferase